MTPKNDSDKITNNNYKELTLETLIGRLPLVGLFGGVYIIGP